MTPATPATTEERWLAFGRTAFALVVVVALAVLGVTNIGLRARWHEVEDGVLWGGRPEGVKAVEVAAGSAAARAGILPGDILVSVNGSPIQTPADIVEFEHRSQEGTRLSYTLLRLGARQALDVSLTAIPQGSSMYFVFAAVGLFTLLVGAAVRLRRPRDQATLHFFWLCVVFFGTFTFSFNGPLDRLDWIFYWGDALATALLPPLLVHFTLVFPARPAGRQPLTARAESMLAPLMYTPALLLVAARALAIGRGSSNGVLLTRAIDSVDRAEHVYLFLGSLVALGVLLRAFQQITATSGTARRQLYWLAWGTVLGVGPFALAYALPWALGIDPPLGLQLTAIPLGLVPLAFASAIARYRLRDVEVIIKRGLAYTAFMGASVFLYVALLKLTSFLFANDADDHNWIVAGLATVVVVLLAQPVKQAVQNALDRFFYRDRYDYRRALVAFASDLNRDLDVVRLSQRLVSRIVETLLLDRMALMLADERSGDFSSIGEYGFPESLPSLGLGRSSSFMARLDGGHTVALDDPIAAARFLAEEVESWRDAGIYYFVPCVFEGGAIAVLALGHKQTDEPFNSEDLSLLTAVASQVATAIENGRLYRQLHLKAEEVGRMREFNDNILESLDDGLVVFDGDERIVRWNVALERFYGVTRDQAVGQTLGSVFAQPFVEALRAARVEHPRGATLSRVPLTRRAADGDRSRILVNATEVPLQNLSGAESSVAGTILLVEDITDRVRLEEQLQISEKMASIGLLAAGVAHEVNTPLTGISSFTQMLLEGADPGDPKTVLLEKIERQTFRAAKIVNGLLNLSRPGGATGNERTTVDLNVVIGEVFSLIEHQFEVGSIKVRRELSASPVTVLGIEHQLQQVFLNLFLNARDAMPSGGWLSVSTRLDGDRATVVIADTGSGIPPEQLARIYDPFFTTKAIGQGTGLGLSITYGIVREHEGSIRCDSAVGKGTRFALTLPLAPAHARSAAR